MCEACLAISRPRNFPNIEGPWVTNLYRLRGSEVVLVHSWTGVKTDVGGLHFRVGLFEMSDSLRIEVIPKSSVGIQRQQPTQVGDSPTSSP